MKTRYYRHNDPRRGFKLCQELQIATPQKLMYSSEIQTINLMYRQCADKHSQCFMAQPNENEILQQIIILLFLPITVSLILQNYSFIVHQYVIASIAILYCIKTYMNKINKGRQQFDAANQMLKQQFFMLQRSFEERWPNCSLALLREWNQLNETCTQYIEICSKSNMIIEAEHPQTQNDESCPQFSQKQQIQGIDEMGDINIIQ